MTGSKLPWPLSRATESATGKPLAAVRVLALAGSPHQGPQLSRPTLYVSDWPATPSYHIFGRNPIKAPILKQHFRPVTITLPRYSHSFPRCSRCALERRPRRICCAFISPSSFASPNSVSTATVLGKPDLQARDRSDKLVSVPRQESDPWDVVIRSQTVQCVEGLSQSGRRI